MNYFLYILILALMFSGCDNSQQQDQNQTELNQSNIDQYHVEEKKVVKEEKTLTIYIHGFSKDGFQADGVYGDEVDDKSLDLIRELSENNKSKNIVSSTTYYGSTPPAYYTQNDIDEIENITKIYGGGIPRYATIVGKYIKHILNETNATEVNILSVSMGSLVNRWLIEKDIENLASQKLIKKWLSIEGVIAGNYAASSNRLNDIVNTFVDTSIDIEHMRYKWISDNLSAPTLAGSPYYKDILMGQVGSTNDNLNNYALTWLMGQSGQFFPNDGYQKLDDTYFQNILESSKYHGFPPTLTFFHQNHLTLQGDKGAWAQAATFFSSSKRIKITLINATVSDIHENNEWYFNQLPAEVVFESEVYSEEVYNRWGITDAISERVIQSGALDVHEYNKDGETKSFEQVIYDDFVLESETKLILRLAGYEIDYDFKYGIYEASNDYTSLGESIIEVELQDGIYEVESNEWNGYIKVEVILIASL